MISQCIKTYVNYSKWENQTPHLIQVLIITDLKYFIESYPRMSSFNKDLTNM